MMQSMCCTQYASKFRKLSNCPRTGNGQFSSQSQRKAMPKNAQNYTHLTCYQSNTQNLRAKLQHYVKCEFPDVPAGFRKGRGTRDQITNICWIIVKAREFQKNIYSALLTSPNPLTVWITAKCGKFLKRRDYQTT